MWGIHAAECRPAGERFSERLIDAGRPRRRAHAHSGVDVYMYMRASDDSTVVGTVQFPTGHLRSHAHIPISESPTAAELGEHRSALATHIADNLTITEDSRVLEIELTNLRTISTKGGSYVIVGYRLADPSPPLPRRLTVSAAALLELDHHLRIVLMVPTRVGWGRFRHRIRDDHELDHHHPACDVEIRPTSVGDDLSGTLRELTRRISKRLGRAPERAA